MKICDFWQLWRENDKNGLKKLDSAEYSWTKGLPRENKTTTENWKATPREKQG